MNAIFNITDLFYNTLYHTEVKCLLQVCMNSYSYGNFHFQVIDIEEMAWAPKYGLKGMIDASVRVNIMSNYSKCAENVMPLEFKTGKVPAGQASM